MLKANPVWKGYVTSCKILLWILKWQQWSWWHRGHLAASCSFTPGRRLPDSFPTAYQRAAGRPPRLHPTANMRWQSHLGKGAQREQRGPPSAKPAPPEGAGSGGQEWLGPGHESCSALLKQAHAVTWFPLQPRCSETCPLRHPGGRMRLRRCVLGAQRMFPAYHNYRNICAQQLSVELLWKFTVFDCFQNFSLLSLRQGGLKAASELLQEVREVTVSRVWMKCGIRVWGVSLGALSAVDFHQLVIFSSFCIQSTCACWAWCELTWQWITIYKSWSSKSQ